MNLLPPPPCYHVLTTPCGRARPRIPHQPRTAYPATRLHLGHQALILEMPESLAMAAIPFVPTILSPVLVPSDPLRCLPRLCFPITARPDQLWLPRKGDTRWFHTPIKRYQEWYQGGTQRYQQAVPGDTRQYQPPQRAVLARYRVVRRYRPGLTFSPVPPRRYPVPGQKMGDTGAVRAVGTAWMGITSITLTPLTANAVHEVKPPGPMCWTWLHFQAQAAAEPEGIKRGVVMNQTEGVVFAVSNEQGVVVSFAQQGPEHGFYFASIQTAFPDAIIWHEGIRYRVEFEYQAKSFLHHQHDVRGCDLIICWYNDYPDSILPVLALSDPTWPETLLVLPDAMTRELTYWRERALTLERQLKRQQLSSQQTPQGRRIRPRTIQTVTAKQKAAILAWHAQGLTDGEIGQQIFGQHNERTKRWIRFVLENVNAGGDNEPGTQLDNLCPFPVERPPTPKEQAHIRQLFALGLSRNRICSAVYGFKNTKILGWINDALAELDEEDDEEETSLERITA